MERISGQRTATLYLQRTAGDIECAHGITGICILHHNGTLHCQCAGTKIYGVILPLGKQGHVPFYSELTDRQIIPSVIGKLNTAYCDFTCTGDRISIISCRVLKYIRCIERTVYSKRAQAPVVDNVRGIHRHAIINGDRTFGSPIGKAHLHIGKRVGGGSTCCLFEVESRCVVQNYISRHAQAGRCQVQRTAGKIQRTDCGLRRAQIQRTAGDIGGGDAQLPRAAHRCRSGRDGQRGDISGAIHLQRTAGDIGCSDGSLTGCTDIGGIVGTGNRGGGDARFTIEIHRRGLGRCIGQLAQGCLPVEVDGSLIRCGQLVQIRHTVEGVCSATGCLVISCCIRAGHAAGVGDIPTAIGVHFHRTQQLYICRHRRAATGGRLHFHPICQHQLAAYLSIGNGEVTACHMGFARKICTQLQGIAMAICQCHFHDTGTGDIFCAPGFGRGKGEGGTGIHKDGGGGERSRLREGKVRVVFQQEVRHRGGAVYCYLRRRTEYSRAAIDEDELTFPVGFVPITGGGIGIPHKNSSGGIV